MKKILIVDDDNMNCILAKHALADSYEVMVLHSGIETLAYLEKEMPDLILMDIEMPEMDGKEVVKRIKENEDWSKIPIIFLTADSNPMTEVECLNCGAEDFIVKPFVSVVMKSRVERIMESQELRKELEQQLENKTKKSLTDALTGLHNRDYLEKEMRDYLGQGHGGVLFMIDLDNFKTINDTYGHIVGDKILQYFSEIMLESARRGDIVCRLAGDEFVMFYKELVDKDIIANKAEQLITSFAKKMGALGYAGIVSVSVGIKITDGNESFQELYDKADKSLYFVKNNGKNAYHFFDENNEKVGNVVKEISTDADLNYIRDMLIEGVEGTKGAFHVAYDEFKKIYDFVWRCVTRKKQMVQIVLFTIDITSRSQMHLSVEEAMEILTASVISSLRAIDTGTKYSSRQYMVILMDTDIVNGRNVAERVIKKFYANEAIKDVDVNITYDIQTLE